MTEDEILAAEISDVTDQIAPSDQGPLPATDKVFLALGRHIKVRRVPTKDRMPFGMGSYHVSGSHVDSDGWAQPTEFTVDGETPIAWAVVPATTWTPQSDSAETTVAEQLHGVVEDCVRSVLRAIKLHEELAAL